MVLMCCKERKTIMMRSHFPIILVQALLVLTTYAGGGKPRAEPAAKKATIAKKKGITPEQAAENKRFSGTNNKYRSILLALDKTNKKLIDKWVEIRDAQDASANCHRVWGTKARRDAEKQREKLKKDLPKMKEYFEKLVDKQIRGIERDLGRKSKEIKALESKSPSTNEGLNARRAEALANLRAEAQELRDSQAAIEDMTHALSDYAKIASSGDRLQQLGLSKHDSTLHKEIDKYSKIIEAAYDIKDIKADIKVLEARKKDAKDWKSGDERTLSSLRSRLEKAGAGIEKLVEKERKKIKSEAEKLERKIRQLQGRIDATKEGSKSYDRYTDDKWELEAEVHALETKDAFFLKLATWKDPEKKPAAKPAAKPVEKAKK